MEGIPERVSVDHPDNLPRLCIFIQINGRTYANGSSDQQCNYHYVDRINNISQNTKGSLDRTGSSA